MKPPPKPEPDPTTPPSLADGSLLIAPNGTFYVIYGHAKFALGRPTAAQFAALGLNPQTAQRASLLVINELSTVPAAGTALREVSSPAVYVVWGLERLHVPDPPTLFAWGYNWDVVHVVPDGSTSAWPVTGTLPPRALPPEAPNFEPPRPELLAVVQTATQPMFASTLVTPNRNGAFEVPANAPFTLRLATASLRSLRFFVNGAALLPAPATASLTAFVLSKGVGTVAVQPAAGAATDVVVRLPGGLATSVIEVHNEGGAAAALLVPIAAPTFDEFLVHRVSLQNDVVMLVDGQTASHAILSACIAATSSIRVMQLEFEPNFNAFGVHGAQVGFPAGVLLERGRAGVDVRVLLDPLSAVSGADAFEAFVAANHPANFRIKRAPINHVWPGSLATTLPAPRDIVQQLMTYLDVGLIFSGVSLALWWNGITSVLGLQRLHAKLVIIDGALAFISGLPFNNDYWDTPDHELDIADRGAPQPVHTVTHQFRGPAVADLDELFARMWNGSDAVDNAGRDQIAATPPPAPFPGAQQAVQIVRTLPRSVEGSDETGVFEVYLRSIRNAKRFIYLEQQYVTSSAIVDAIRGSLVANPGLQVILLANVRPDVPTYPDLQVRRLRDLVAAGAGVFTLWKYAPATNTLRPIYVESKVAIFDDNVLASGTGNFDGMSLDAGSFSLAGTETFVDCRNVEVNATLYDGVFGYPSTGQVAQMRTTLWQEHLGAAAGPLLDAPPGGWLPFWNGMARQNVAGLNAASPHMAGRILPWASFDPAWPKIGTPDRNDAVALLKALGINPDRFTIPTK